MKVFGAVEEVLLPGSDDPADGFRVYTDLYEYQDEEGPLVHLVRVRVYPAERTPWPYWENFAQQEFDVDLPLVGARRVDAIRKALKLHDEVVQRVRTWSERLEKEVAGA